MKTLQELIQESEIFKLSKLDNKDPQLLTITVLDYNNVPFEIIVGYFNESYNVTSIQIETILKNLVRKELEKIINEISKLDVNRPNFQSLEIYDWGKLVRDIGKVTKENRESREIVKSLVTEHNNRVKKNKIYTKEVEYVIKLINVIENDLIKSVKYTELLELDNYPYSKIYKNRENKHEFVNSRIKELIGAKNIANKFTISKHLDGYLWGSFCKKISLTRIQRIECKQLEKMSERGLQLPKFVNSDEEEYEPTF